jgi:hypothetical protein
MQSINIVVDCVGNDVLHFLGRPLSGVCIYDVATSCAGVIRVTLFNRYCLGLIPDAVIIVMSAMSIYMDIDARVKRWADTRTYTVGLIPATYNHMTNERLPLDKIMKGIHDPAHGVRMIHESGQDNLAKHLNMHARKFQYVDYGMRIPYGVLESIIKDLISNICVIHGITLIHII